MDLEGLSLSEDEANLLEHPAIAGVIFFQRNYADPQQLTELISAVRATSHGKELLLCVDQEGGRVQRFTSPFTPLPAPGDLLRSCGSESEARLLSHELGWLMASELITVGIDISFAPVLDVDIGVSTVIGNRSFADHAGTTIDMAEAYVSGMSEAGMAATGKHFPGHGGVVADSHLESPIDQRSYEQLHQSEMCVFQALIKMGIAGIMPSHVIYKAIDERPACFSEFWLQTILRERFHFDGCIFSDDLSMLGASVAGNAVERADLALHAGCDVLLCCNDRLALIAVMEAIDRPHNTESTRRLSAMRSNTQYNPSTEALYKLQNTSRYHSLRHKLEELCD